MTGAPHIEKPALVPIERRTGEEKRRRRRKQSRIISATNQLKCLRLVIHHALALALGSKYSLDEWPPSLVETVLKSFSIFFSHGNMVYASGASYGQQFLALVCLNTPFESRAADLVRYKVL